MTEKNYFLQSLYIARTVNCGLRGVQRTSGVCYLVSLHWAGIFTPKVTVCTGVWHFTSVRPNMAPQVGAKSWSVSTVGTFVLARPSLVSRLYSHLQTARAQVSRLHAHLTLLHAWMYFWVSSPTARYPWRTEHQLQRAQPCFRKGTRQMLGKTGCNIYYASVSIYSSRLSTLHLSVFTY